MPDPKLKAAIESFKKKNEAKPVVGVKGPVVPWAGNYKAPAKNEWVSQSLGLGNWDYKVANATDRRGPNGEPMAPGQKAWDAYGRPYYGFGFEGFARAATSKYQLEVDRLRGIKSEKWYGAFLPGLDETAIKLRAGGKAFLDIVGMVNVFVEKTEQGIGTIGGLGEAGTELGSPLPEIGKQEALPAITGKPSIKLPTAPGGEAIAKFLESLPIVGQIARSARGDTGKPLVPEQDIASFDRRALARAKNIGGFLANLTKLGNAYNSFRILTAPATLEEKYDAVKAQNEASKILFTNLMEPAVKAEFSRRYIAGEDPGLLALELQDPLYEFVGQMALDPLNLWGFGGKAARQTANLRGTAVFYKASDEAVDLLKTYRVGNQAEALEALTKLTEAANAQYRAKQAASALDFGIAAATAPAKRAALVETSMSLVNRLAKDVRDPDTLIEIMQAMVLRGADDALEMKEGISRILSIANKGTVSPSLLLSGAGDELAFVLREAIGGDPVRFYDDVLQIVAKGDVVNEAGKTVTVVERLAQHSEQRLGNAAEKIFPDIATRIARGEDVGRVATALHNFESKAGPTYKFLNTFYSRIYMGMSPGYAMRNAIQNTFHIFIDEGLHNPMGYNAIHANGVALMGGVESRAALRKIRTPMAGAEQVVQKKGLFKSVTTYFSEIADKFEGNAAKTIVGLSIDRNMRKMAPRALESARPILRAGGVTDDQIRAIEHLIMQGKGDVAGALDMVTQRVDAFRLLASHSPEEAKALQGFGTLLSDVEEILGIGLGRAESQARIMALADEIDGIADDVLREIPGVSKDADGFADAVVYSTIENDPALKGSFNALIQANNNSMDVTILTAEQTLRKLNDPLLLGRLDPKQVEVVRDITARYTALADPEMRYLIKNFAETSGDDFMKTVEELTAIRTTQLSPEDTVRYFERFGMPGTPPAEGVSAQMLLDEAYWWFREVKRKFYAGIRDNAYTQTASLLDEAMEFAKTAGIELDDSMFLHATQMRQEAEVYQDAFMLKDGLHRISLGGVEGVDIPELRPFQFGVGDAEILRLPQTGDIRDSRQLLAIINEYNPSGKTFDSLKDVTMETARRALANREADLAQATLRFEEGAQAVPEITKLAPPYDGRTPSMARVAHESREGVRATLESIVANMDGTAGKTVEVGMDDELRKAYEAVASQRIQEARAITMDVAGADRDFALHDYRMRNNFDQALGYIYPYQFWYSRTYANWVKRLSSQPNILSGYLRYKDYMGKIHAGAPEWWKYNINTNELLGLNSDSPLYFNLEALLNPLNGIAGVDFNDPYKRTNWFTSAVDDMSKYGPSIHSIYSLAMAMGLYATGEKDAASRWAGRLFPQTGSLIKPATALALDKPVEVDPWVWLFSGGLDPYERRRVQRGLSALVNEGLIGEADAIEAARLQKGPVWDEAVLRASQERAPGQLSSYFLGAGFKARSQSDMQIDQFYQDWYRLWDMEPNLSPAEVQGAMDELRNAYPFMDTLLLSRKGGLDRDRNYVYNVLGRIPPSMSDDIAKVAGIEPEMLSKFYDEKGHIEGWSETDRAKFMAGIVDIAAVLDLPDGATRDTWNSARSAYKELEVLGEKQFGQDIWDKVDAYFAMRGDTQESRDAANRLLEANPIVSFALDWKAQAIMFSPTLSAYYTSLDKIDAYFTGEMYTAIERELGSGIWDTWDEYWALASVSTSEARAFYKQHPELDRYGEIKDAYEETIVESTLNVAGLIQVGPGPKLRDIQEELGFGGQAVQQFTQTPRDILPMLSLEDWSELLGERLLRLVLDGEDIPSVGQRTLDDIAAELGVPSGAYIPGLVRQSIR